MNSEGRTKFLVGVLVLALASYAFVKRAKKSEVQIAASQSAEQAVQPIQNPNPPAAAQPPRAVATPVGTQAAQPPVNKVLPPPPMPTISPEMQKRLAAINANLPKEMPKEYMDMVDKQKRRAEAAFTSESQARVQLKEMEKCIDQAKIMKDINIPSGASGPDGGMAGAQAQMQAGCAQVAQQLVQKFPSLKNEYNANIAPKLNHEPLQRANQRRR